MKLAVAAILSLLSVCAYAQDWSSDYNAPIIRALAKNDVPGCGEYRFRPTDFEGEYLVQCTRDREEWTTYKVWPGIQKVMRAKN